MRPYYQKFDKISDSGHRGRKGWMKNARENLKFSQIFGQKLIRPHSSAYDVTLVYLYQN